MIKTIADSYVTVKKNQAVFLENTKPAGIYLLKQGKIKISKSDSKHKEQILGYIKSTRFLGLSNLISEEKYSTNAIAIEDSVLFFIPKQKFFNLIYEYPNICYEILISLNNLLDKTESKLIALMNK